VLVAAANIDQAAAEIKAALRECQLRECETRRPVSGLSVNTGQVWLTKLTMVG
jgi:hypothetical protein